MEAHRSCCAVVAGCCRVLQGVAGCCRVLQGVAQGVEGGASLVSRRHDKDIWGGFD